MTKADIADRIQEQLDISKKDSVVLLETVFSVMKSTLEAGENLKISGFGNFEIKQKNDRLGRNPTTGEPMTIEARKILSFKPSPLLRRAVNGGN